MSIAARSRIALAVAVVGLGAIAGTAAAGAETPAEDSTAPVADVYVTPSSTVAPEVLGNQVERPAEVAGAAQAATAEQAAPAQVQGTALAFTGSDVTTLALVGGAAVAAGTAIVVARRRHTA